MEQNIREIIINNQNKKGLYNVIITKYNDTICNLLESGYNISMIIEYIEKDLDLENGTIKYHSFYRSLLRKKIKGKNVEMKHEVKTDELDKIDLNIGIEKNKNLFDNL